MNAAYHHGALRDALVDAAVEVVATSGIEAVSLRELARRVGVSSGAPYRHFADKDAVLAAVARRGFERFDRALARVSKQYAPAPALEAVQRLGVAYVRFAAKHPNLFRLIFGPAAPRVGVDAALDEARRRAGAHLPRALGRLQAEGVATHTSTRELTELAWALVHGVAMLHLDGLVGGGGVASAERLAERVTGQLGALLRVS